MDNPESIEGADGISAVIFKNAGNENSKYNKMGYL